MFHQGALELNFQSLRDLWSWPVTNFTSPRRFTAAVTLVSNSSGNTSTWMNLTSGLNLGGLPKCSIQFNLHPNSRTTSAYPKAVDLAGDIFWPCESWTTPLPMGVGRNGSPDALIKLLTTCSALDIAHAFPIITRGFLAFFIKPTAYSICWAGATDRGILST